MNKKFFILLFSFIFVMFQSVCAVKALVREYGNDTAHIEAAKELNRIDGVAEAAVVSCEKRILVGISVFDGADLKNIGKEARMVIATRFSKIKQCRINVGNTDALKIIELSGFIETDLDRNMLKKRFEFLMEDNRQS